MGSFKEACESRNSRIKEIQVETQSNVINVDFLRPLFFSLPPKCYLFFILGTLTLSWHRGKLPFEIPNFAKFCHKNCQILPQKIAKFATFCQKNCQILQIKFTYRITFFCSRRPGILHSSKDAHKKSLRCISEGGMIKNINLISK